MSLSPDDRAAFLELLTDLGPGADRRRALAFARANLAECIDELGDVPGNDQVRAGVLRMLDDLVSGEARQACLERASAALDAFPEDLRRGDPTVLLTRHPSWVGLAALEESDRAGVSGVDRAVRLATAGFQALTPGTGRGEVLWAMAEQADDAGWTDRARSLLAAAGASAFARPANAARVALLLALAAAEAGDPSAEAALVSVAEDEGASLHTRAHAATVVAGLHDGRGDLGGARRWLERALDFVDEESEPDLAGRTRDALRDVEKRWMDEA